MNNCAVDILISISFFLPFETTKPEDILKTKRNAYVGLERHVGDDFHFLLIDPFVCPVLAVFLLRVGQGKRSNACFIMKQASHVYVCYQCTY